MTNDEYVQLAIKTEAEYTAAQKRLNHVNVARLLHAGLGLATEAGEILDQIKKHVYYGKDLDFINLKEEAGDLMWYMAILADTCGLKLESIMATNIIKLKKRYGEKFSGDKALIRDLIAERGVLEDE